MALEVYVAYDAMNEQVIGVFASSELADKFTGEYHWFSVEKFEVRTECRPFFEERD